MARVEKWETLLADHLEGILYKPFVWGENDCVLFSANAVQLITGIDHAAEIRGQYNTKFGAAKLIKQVANGNIELFMGAHFKEIPVTMAQRGDVVMRQQALGICYGAKSYFAGLPITLVCPTKEASKAWRVE